MSWMSYMHLHLRSTVNRRRLSILLQDQTSVTCGAILQPTVHLLTLKHWPSKLPCTVHWLALHNWACSVWEPGATQNASQGQFWREISISGGAFDHQAWPLIIADEQECRQAVYKSEDCTPLFLAGVCKSRAMWYKKSARGPLLWFSGTGLARIVIQDSRAKTRILIMSAVPLSDLDNIRNHITPNHH